MSDSVDAILSRHPGELRKTSEHFDRFFRTKAPSCCSVPRTELSCKSPNNATVEKSRAGF